MLRVRCRGCETSFLSAHQERIDDLRGDASVELREACPHCGSDGDYRAADYRFGLLVGPCSSLGTDLPAPTASA